MNLTEFRQLFAKAPDKFPSGLESRYPRVLTQILEKWDSPRELDAFLKDLVVDFRGTRQGFPPEILKEILFLAALFERWRAERKRKADPTTLAALSPSLVEGIDRGQRPLDAALIKELRDAKILVQRDSPGELGSLDRMLNQRDRDGMTLLMHAASVGAEKSMIHLIKQGANPHLSDSVGNRALHWAVTMGRLRSTEILLYFGADPSAKNQAGIAPLALAALKPDASMASRLLDYGADPNQPDGKGDFPLHRAVHAGVSETVRLLLQAGASKDMQNRDGKSPLDIAGRGEMQKVFQQYQAELIRSAMQK